jgi:hypothetical protein
MNYFKNNRRTISLCLLFTISFQTLSPGLALALTSGPSQPEVQSFQPVGASDLVDLFSGDFSYNIPLFELPGPNGGYPFNLSYQAGINTDQEASWVGLGWNLQPGAINRQVRGLPDEFNGGDKIKTKMSIAPNVTAGVGVGASVEVFGGDGVSLNVGLSVYHNSYRGLGYSIDGNLGFSKASSSGATAGVGLGLRLDSNEGASLSPSLSLGTKDINIGLGIGYNSKGEISNLSFDSNLAARSAAKSRNAEKKKTNAQIDFGGASMSFAHPGYTPQITTPMTGSSISATLKVGGAFWGIFGSPYISGFYNESRLTTNKRWVSTPAYGYLNYDKAASDQNALMDVNREKDGIVTAISPNLAIPSLTYDIYSVSGQGISAMYRPMRNDYGATKDQQVSSESSGGSGGLDLGPALIHPGINLSLNHARSVSGVWNNDMTAKAKFTSSELGKPYEPVYFKAHGDFAAESAKTLEDLGNERAVRVKLRDVKEKAEATNELQYGNKELWSKPLAEIDKSQPRKSRNQTIQPYTNAQLLSGTQAALPHFKVQYIDEGGAQVNFDRLVKYKQSDNTLLDLTHHTAAFTATTPEGLRYNYGIPAYNFVHEEITFSSKQPVDVDKVSIEPGAGAADDEPNYNYGNEKYLKRVETPPYAHSYLLTSILGPDYVDLTSNGVTDDDLGYWVKFTYQRTASETNPFNWRDPFEKAHLQEGWKSDRKDDKGSFVYGKKEMWYLRRAETKSHVAEFTISARDDGKGADKKLQNTPGTKGAVYRLDKIALYTRFGTISRPIKTVRFRYVENSPTEAQEILCKKTQNSTITPRNPYGGKLTLKEVWFEYGGSSRGSFNPYVFKYHSFNPDYQLLSYDRWGNYKPNNTTRDAVTNNVFPYVSQDPATKADIDKYAAAWSLTEIRLPSGGTVKVDYESDDYAYVQHKQAMQMTEVVTPEGPSGSVSNSNFSLKDNNLKVRFKLKKAIPVNSASEDGGYQSKVVLKYIDESTYQLYFKFLISLLEPAENANEYISGYVDIQKHALLTPMQLEKNTDGSEFIYGSFYVKPESERNPFSLRAWQHVRTNQPDLANPGPTNSTEDAITKIWGVASMAGVVLNIFRSFYGRCDAKGWGREVKAGKAWVRLKSPDKMKYGGGLRVKQITLKDNWANDEEGVYGQVYDYTTTETEGGPMVSMVSSGVAAYEPFVGGDENPLRYAKKYPESVPLRATNTLFFEYPINESYYPGPQVGYSKVTVSSLASASLAGKSISNSVFPTGSGVSFGTSGKTVHEFFTAKDFPVITDETEKENQPYQLSVTVPFIGNLSISKLTASQGYSIVTNDMHGKPKKISNYRQDPLGKFEPEPISWVKYNYASTPRYYQQEKVFSLSNQFVDNGEGTLSLPTSVDAGKPRFTLGQESEFFMDMRKFEDNAFTGGVRLNFDILFFLWFTIPAFVPWPSVTTSENQLRTAVTNKVIFKSGILESTEAYDGGSLVKTSNLKWDKQTGALVLSTVNNNFDAPVFSYNILAYQKYQGMGAAYQNIGLTFTATNVQAVPNQTNQYQFTVKETLPANALYAGDEMLLYSATASTLAAPIAHAVYAGEENGNKRWHTESTLPTATTSYKAMIVRSGYRNQLSVSAGSITALEDPSVKGAVVKFSKTIQVPR